MVFNSQNLNINLHLNLKRHYSTKFGEYVQKLSIIASSRLCKLQRISLPRANKTSENFRIVRSHRYYDDLTTAGALLTRDKNGPRKIAR